MWFLRIGILLAGLILAPLGIRIRCTGTTFAIVSFANSVLPLRVLELHLSAWRSPQVGAKYFDTAMLAGPVGVTMFASLAAEMLM